MEVGEDTSPFYFAKKFNKRPEKTHNFYDAGFLAQYYVSRAKTFPNLKR
jgi:hypothetical protein